MNEVYMICQDNNLSFERSLTTVEMFKKVDLAEMIIFINSINKDVKLSDSIKKILNKRK